MSKAFALLRTSGSVVTWGAACPPCRAVASRAEDLDYGGDCSEVAGQLGDVQEIFCTEGAFAALTHDGRVVTWGHRPWGGQSCKVGSMLLNT